jgi:hypothetical protein
MALTPQQLAALKADILADTALAPQAGTPDGRFAIAAAYNVVLAPAFTVWKKSVSIAEVGDKINATELGGLTTLNNTRLQTVVVLSQTGINPSLADRRQFFDDIFSGAGGVNTRANLLALWKELATRAQKLFSTGTGTDAAPATTAANISQGFRLTFDDVTAAMP